MKNKIVFVLLTYSISWFFWGLKLLIQQDVLSSVFSIFGELGVFGPFIAFLIMIKLEKKSLKQTFKNLLQKENNKYLIVFTLGIPFILSGLAYLLVIIFNGIQFELGLSIQMIVPVALIILFVGGPIEEFGWRGYLQPMIRSKYSVLMTGLLIGIIHGVWHLPLHFIEGTVQYEIPIIQFIAITVLNGILFSQIYEYSKSLRPMIILHWMSNLSSAIFMYWTTNEGRIYLFILTLILNIGLFVFLQSKKNPMESKLTRESLN